MRRLIFLIKAKVGDLVFKGLIFIFVALLFAWNICYIIFGLTFGMAINLAAYLSGEKMFVGEKSI